jgi:zinc and cadmium transporter
MLIMDASTLLWVIAATVLDSLIAFVGIITLQLRRESFQNALKLLVAFSAGALLGGALFHLLAESAESLTLQTALVLLVFGFCLFFILERVLKWHHCHEGKCKVHPFSYLILLGDSVHNFIDGLVIAASFLISIPSGIVTTLLVIGHEIPQELGDFAVLVYGGFGMRKALVYNFLSQATCVLGGLMGFFIGEAAEAVRLPLLAFAAGGFLYISASDLIPELHKEERMEYAVKSFASFLAGLAFLLLVKAFAEG